jgi:hypothetical protein
MTKLFEPLLGFSETLGISGEMVRLKTRRIILELTLASHPEYDWNEGVRTPEISLPFEVLGQFCDRET